MVAEAALIVSASKCSKGISAVGTGLREHKVSSEDVCGGVFVGFLVRIYQTSGYDDVVQHFP